ncbi:MAG: 2TM domain-containing protein [Holosporales bacterium]|nr:2TM domain-containing protein [Holosporales bacterium]
MFNDNERDEVIRQYVRELRMFYQDIFTCGVVFFFCLIAWCATGGGFWPIWVLLAFAVKLVHQAFFIGKFKLSDLGFTRKWASFMSPEWEEQQIQKMKRSGERGCCGSPRRASKEPDRDASRCDKEFGSRGRDESPQNVPEHED